jgi:hypothetical protein
VRGGRAASERSHNAPCRVRINFINRSRLPPFRHPMTRTLVRVTWTVHGPLYEAIADHLFEEEDEM